MKISFYRLFITKHPVVHAKLAAFNILTIIVSLQRFIQDLVKHLWWSFFAKIDKGFFIFVFSFVNAYSTERFFNSCRRFFNWTTSCQSLREKCPYSEFFWSAFPHIRTEYGQIRSISPYSVRIRENMDQKNSEYGHFSRCECFDQFQYFPIFSSILELYQKENPTQMFPCEFWEKYLE